jgi:hypothetical protein
MAVVRSGAFRWALAVALAGAAAGCAADQRSAADCIFQLRTDSARLGWSDVEGAFDPPPAADCRYSAPAAAGDPVIPAAVEPMPEAEPGAPLPPPDIDPKLFVPTG